MLKNAALFIALIALGTGITLALDHYTPPPGPAIHTIPPEPEAMQKAVPDFTFSDIKGAAHSVRDFRGKTVVLNFWASWCTPCLKEFPDLLELAAAQPDDLVLIALSSDFEASAMNKFLDKMRSDAPDHMALPNIYIALDDNAAITADLFQTLRLPETILIDKDSNMREKIVGANWTVEEVLEIIGSL